MGKERPPEWYDEAYAQSDNYALDAHSAPWAPLWRAVAARTCAVDRVLDLGCGPGHLATLLRTPFYAGIDSSPVAIDMARARCPNVSFEVGDIESCPWPDADVYLFLEVLEHVDRDLGILTRVPHGRRVIISVPNFDADNHVRHFTTGLQALERYGPLLSLCSVTTVQGVGHTAWHVLEGMR